MSNSLPILRSTSGGLNAQVLYGFTRVVSCLTNVQQFDAGTEQRWVGRTPLFNFSLPMISLTAADRTAWLTFMNTVVGRLTQDLSITLGATTYADLTLETDDFTSINRLPTSYDISGITLRQVRNYPWTVPTAGSSFPFLLFGASSGANRSVQRPFTENVSALTDVNDSPYGQRYAFGWYKTAQAGYPTTLLRSWHVSYSLLTDADALTLETFFLGCQGRYKTFDFLDPIDGNTYHNVRFDIDDLAFKYVTKNQQQAEITLKQIWV